MKLKFNTTQPRFRTSLLLVWPVFLFCLLGLWACGDMMVPDTDNNSIGTTEFDPIQGGLSGYVRIGQSDTLPNVDSNSQKQADVRITLRELATSEDQELRTWEVVTDVNGYYELAAPESLAESYRIEISHDDYLSVIYYSLEIQGGLVTTLDVVPIISLTDEGSGDITGIITNAAEADAEGDAIPEAGVTVSFRNGVNRRDGNVLTSVETDEEGRYTATLDYGVYTAELSKDGFVNNYFTVYSLNGGVSVDQDSTITPSVETGSTRIVLTWGASPADLDAHLTGPTEDGSFHVYWVDKGSTTESPYASLDVDDTTSFGPETVTITRQFSGTYVYYIQDYSNLTATSDSPSTALANSSAKVTVIQGDEVVAELRVPNVDGNLWKVFSLNGSDLILLNEMTYANSTSELSRSLQAVKP